MQRSGTEVPAQRLQHLVIFVYSNSNTTLPDPALAILQRSVVDLLFASVIISLAPLLRALAMLHKSVVDLLEEILIPPPARAIEQRSVVDLLKVTLLNLKNITSHSAACPLQCFVSPTL